MALFISREILITVPSDPLCEPVITRTVSPFLIFILVPISLLITTLQVLMILFS